MSADEGMMRGDALAFLLGIVSGIILASIILDRLEQMGQREKPTQSNEEPEA